MTFTYSFTQSFQTYLFLSFFFISCFLHLNFICFLNRSFSFLLLYEDFLFFLFFFSSLVFFITVQLLAYRWEKFTWKSKINGSLDCVQMQSKMRSGGKKMNVFCGWACTFSSLPRSDMLKRPYIMSRREEGEMPVIG